MALYIRQYFLSLLFLTCTCLLSLLTNAYSAQFFETLYDVPVLLDLKEMPEEALVFDKPSGRIAQAGATSSYSEEVVLKAYQQALSQMGWKNIGGQKFTREGEVLSILVIKSNTSIDDAVMVNFSLHPIEE